jgi:hypothetical protein
MSDIRFRPLDRLLLSVDRLLRLLPGAPAPASRDPADALPEATGLTPAQRHEAAALMRVNHAGELAAQGLYLGQSLAARSPQTLGRHGPLPRRRRPAVDRGFAVTGRPATAPDKGPARPAPRRG